MSKTIKRQLLELKSITEGFEKNLLTEEDFDDTIIILSQNKLTNLIGFPKKIPKHINLRDNLLTSLEGVPENLSNGNLDISMNESLTNLKFVPKEMGSSFDMLHCYNLNDVSDLFETKINFVVGLQLWDLDCQYNKNLAMLPLIKFTASFNESSAIINELFYKNHKLSLLMKEKILNFQNDLIDNGFDDNARWKP